jgi:ketosteroid isomerase-like protein
VVARSVQETLEHHLKALIAQDIDDIVSDYTDDAVLMTPDATVRGKSEIRAFFTHVLKAMPGFADAIKMSRQEIDGDVAYIVWTAPGFVILGTDTVVTRDGKIAVQTFAGHMES